MEEDYKQEEMPTQTLNDSWTVYDKISGQVVGTFNHKPDGNELTKIKNELGYSSVKAKYMNTSHRVELRPFDTSGSWDVSIWR